MQDGFTAAPTRLSRLTAGSVATLMTIAAAAIFPYASAQAPKVPVLFPVFATALAVNNSIIAYLITLQFYLTRRTTVGLLGSAFGYSALMAAMQVATSPGVFSEVGYLGSRSHVGVWMWITRLCGFPLLIVLAMLLLKLSPNHTVPKRHLNWALGGFVFGPAVVTLALDRFLFIEGTRLPLLISPSGSYATLAYGGVGFMMVMAWVAALTSILWVTRLRHSFYGWLALGSYSYILYLLVNFAGAARFTVGWYTSRFFELSAAAIILGALLYEVLKMQQRLRSSYLHAYEESIRDGLTGLFSRRYFDTALSREVASQRRHGRPFSLLMVDIDFFKQYNDRHGHLAGDRCIRKIARCLASQLREGDVVARFGGEEFVAILPNTDEDTALKIAERFRCAVMALQLARDRNDKGNVTVSAGLYTCRSEAAMTPEQMLAQADAALYRAKHAGRNRVFTSRADMVVA
ncbi:sensor domain-containing diguanylate cyclase [Crenobacter sp. SG2303]|uniref:diguanylate cyclase n=1 Tax=Crenobacter oryzisoli TaxID=3056844 RepID=A0ABT7XN74_9NEIS|nr:sensor domain-containing diguanylate cyclase [Crenobacter sp. SG2303]MDN0075240.1 sensor domain-containing diguanylate cyclase [Crenobacter sp. SG2303]